MNQRFYRNAGGNIRVRSASLSRYRGARGSIKTRGRQTCRPPARNEAAHVYTILTLPVPGAIAAFLSMLYGGRYAAATQDDYVGAAHNAFNAAVVALARLSNEGAAYLGFEDNAFTGSLADGVTVLVALLFGFFAGIGAFVVCAFRLIVQG